jgi:hypothetical protein
MSSPARLHRKEENSSVNKVSHTGRLVMDTIEAWVLSHAFLCLIVAICLLMALFVTFLFAITGVSAVESGTYYNNLNNII